MRYPYAKTGTAALLVGALLLPGVLPASAAVTESPVSAPAANYGLSEQIRAAIKSASVAPTETGAQIAVTVRLYNGGTTPTRVPEHELRARTKSGLAYALAPSAANKPALQPKEVVELVYLVEVDNKELGELDRIEFVHVDIYQYPKVEKTLLTIPAQAVWYGMNESAPAKPERLPWGQSFRIPGVNSGLLYTPVEASIQNANGQKAAVVTLLADNPGKGREAIPSFRLDGSSGRKGYEGQRTDTGTTALEPGEQAYLTYVIPLDADAALQDIVVVSTDAFVSPNGGGTVVVPTGKLSLTWSGSGRLPSRTGEYALGEPIAFDALTKVVDKKTEVSLVEFHIHENAEDGFRTAVAKFKMTNRGDAPVPTPDFASEIANGQGVSYKGARQTTPTVTLNPGLSYVVSYSYVLPHTEEANEYTMNILDEVAEGTYTTTSAAFPVEKQDDRSDRTFSLYPFEVAVNRIQPVFTYNAGLYQYKFELDLTIESVDDVVLDSGFSKLRFEIVDSFGRIIGTQDAALTGANKLISGKQTLETGNLKSDQYNYPFTINLYEVIETETGTAKRFLMKM